MSTETATEPDAASTRPRAYAGIGYLFSALMVGTTLPTPLYATWEKTYRFGSITTTLIFATYALGVMAALLLAGRSSDTNGRRPVLGVAMVLSAVASVLFILANGIAVLFVARLVSGLSAGLATAAATAALVDLAGPGRRLLGGVVPGVVNLLGLGAGPALGGILAEHAAQPTVLPFVVHLGLLVVAAPALLAPDTVTRRGRPVTVQRPDVGVPAHGRGTFAAAALAGFITFALLGLFTSLVPTFLGQTLHKHQPAVIGASIALLFAVAIVTQLALANVGDRLSVMGGLAVMVVALGLIVASLDVASYPLFLAGTAVAGAAVGAAFSGGLATALDVAGDNERGRVSSTFFLIAYVGLTIPVISVGIGTTEAGILPAVITAAAVLAALDIGALAYLRTRSSPDG